MSKILKKFNFGKIMESMCIYFQLDTINHFVKLKDKG